MVPFLAAGARAALRAASPSVISFRLRLLVSRDAPLTSQEVVVEVEAKKCHTWPTIAEVRVVSRRAVGAIGYGTLTRRCAGGYPVWAGA